MGEGVGDGAGTKQADLLILLSLKGDGVRRTGHPDDAIPSVRRLPR